MVAERIKDVGTLENILNSYHMDKESIDYWNSLISDINEEKEKGEWDDEHWETLISSYILCDEFGTKQGIADFSIETEHTIFKKNKSFVNIYHFTFFSEEFYDTYTRDFIEMLKKSYPEEREIRMIYLQKEQLTYPALIKAGFTEKKGKYFGKPVIICSLKF